MSLTGLPTEILDAVAEYVPAKALWSLASTCSILHEVALKQLWYQVRIDFTRAKGRNRNRKRCQRGHYYIHKQPSKITSFVMDCFCRRSNVRINMDVIGPLLTLHSKRPLPFDYVRRLFINLQPFDYKFVDEVMSYKFCRHNNPRQKMIHWYNQLFKIISNLNLTSIMVIQLHNFTPEADTFRLVGYLATLTSAPVYLNTRFRQFISSYLPFNMILPYLRVVQLDFTMLHDIGTSRALLKEFLQKMVLPNLENIHLYCKWQIAADTTYFESFFTHCKTLKVLRLHGVHPLGTTLDWIPNSVNTLHFLGTRGYDSRDELITPVQDFENLVACALPNVTELLFSGSDWCPPPINPHQLSLPNLRRLVVQGETPYLDSILRQFPQSVQEFRAYNISYGRLTPFIHKILPLQTLIVLRSKRIPGENFIHSWLQFISQLHDLDTAILTVHSLGVSDYNLSFSTLCENKVNYSIIHMDNLSDYLLYKRSKHPKLEEFHMYCDICAQYPVLKEFFQITAQSFDD